MDYVERFSDRDLERIVDEATVYMCACPAQVAVALRQLRGLYRYQMACLRDADNLATVHRTIADSVIAAHGELQDCLDRVLDMEGWDRDTLTMPPGLRKKQADFIDGGEQ